MKELSKKDLRIIAKIEASKELMKGIESLNYGGILNFLQTAKVYIKATKENRMFCIIQSVSSSGMSRVINFHSYEKGKCGGYRNYFAFFKALGYAQTSNGFRIHGCGMDMIFHTNYTIIHRLYCLGFISKKECEKLCQKTPTKF